MKDKKRLMTTLIGLSIICLVAGTVSGVRAADYSVGGGIGLAPDYEGSDDYEVVPIPFGEAVFENGMFMKLEGLNFKFNMCPARSGN